MHAAPSVILFTVLSGAGFGYLAFLGMGGAAAGGAGAAQFALGFALAVAGLVASSFHLGTPERAWRAFSQWRTSWLSREAWLAIAALMVMGAYALAEILLGRDAGPLGAVGALLSLATVLASAMIYTQLRTVPRWNTALTPVHFLAAALAGGAILWGNGVLAVALLLALAVVQVAVWMRGDGAFAGRGHSLATATGLGRLGRPRMFESPHSSANYLVNEFMHDVGRRHAVKLRVIALLAMCLLPALALALSPGSAVAAAFAFALYLAGALVSRWLFFSQAEHVVRLYYDRARP